MAKMPKTIYVSQWEHHGIVALSASMTPFENAVAYEIVAEPSSTRCKHPRWYVYSMPSPNGDYHEVEYFRCGDCGERLMPTAWEEVGDE